MLKNISKLIIVLPLSVVILILVIPTVILHLSGKLLTVIATYPLRRVLGLLMPFWSNLTGMGDIIGDISSKISGGEDEPES
jgi:hypothetical protein